MSNQNEPSIVQEVWSIYKRRIRKNAFQTASIFALLFFLTKLIDYKIEQNFYLLIFEILLAIAIPIGEIIDIIFNKKKQGLLNKLNKLEDNIDAIGNEKNEQKIYAVNSRLEKSSKLVSEINKGQSRVWSLQNYEYIREIYGRILTEVMQDGSQYITLSSLGFWSKRPFLEFNGRKGFIETNVGQIDSGKYIRRIVVIDKRLLLSDIEIGTLEIADELKDELLQDKKNLKDVVLDFHKYGFNFEQRYPDKLLTLFYCVDQHELNLLRPYLASVLVLTSDFKYMMLIQTKNLTEIEEKNTEINQVFCEIIGTLNIDSEMKHDIVHILKCLKHLLHQKKILYPKDIPASERLIKLDSFITTYEKIYSLIQVQDDTFIEDNIKIKTVDAVYRQLGLK